MKNKGLKYLVAITLIINAATLLFFWLHRPPHGGNPGLRPDRVLVDALKMDKKQQALYRTLHQEHHRIHDSLLTQIAAKRQVLYVQKQAASDSMIQEIGFLQAEIERVTYEHFKDVLKICTPKQQAQLDALLGKTVQRILMPKKTRQKPGNER
jgi:hypothetical protein